MRNKEIKEFELLTLTESGHCIGGFSEVMQAFSLETVSGVANNCKGGNCSSTSCTPYKTRSKRDSLAVNNCAKNCVKGCSSKKV